jgi:hypothetical protein
MDRRNIANISHPHFQLDRQAKCIQTRTHLTICDSIPAKYQSEKKFKGLSLSSQWPDICRCENQCYKNFSLYFTNLHFHAVSKPIEPFRIKVYSMKLFHPPPAGRSYVASCNYLIVVLIF